MTTKMTNDNGKRGEMSDVIRILVTEPGKPPVARFVRNNMDVMNEIVGGNIREVDPFSVPAALLYNGKGDEQGLPRNFPLKNGNGEPYELIRGTFLMAGVRDGHYDSLTDTQIYILRELIRRDRFPAESARSGVMNHAAAKRRGLFMISALQSLRESNFNENGRDAAFHG